MNQPAPIGPARSEQESGELVARRRVLKDLIAFSTGAFALAFAIPALAIRTLSFEKKAVAAGDSLVYASGDRSGQPVLPADLVTGEGVQAYPNGKSDPNNLVQLVKLAEGDTAEAFVAYSAICTHLGCTVNAKLDISGNIICPCHASQFDPRQAAKPVAGPAARALPALPIKIGEDGSIAVNGEFDGPVGVA
jgi:Rieske Fe-S protein